MLRSVFSPTLTSLRRCASRAFTSSPTPADASDRLSELSLSAMNGELTQDDMRQVVQLFRDVAFSDQRFATPIKIAGLEDGVFCLWLFLLLR